MSRLLDSTSAGTVLWGVLRDYFSLSPVSQHFMELLFFSCIQKPAAPLPLSLQTSLTAIRLPWSLTVCSRTQKFVIKTQRPHIPFDEAACCVRSIKDVIIVNIVRGEKKRFTVWGKPQITNVFCVKMPVGHLMSAYLLLQ